MPVSSGGGPGTAGASVLVLSGAVVAVVLVVGLVGGGRPGRASVRWRGFFAQLDGLLGSERFVNSVVADLHLGYLMVGGCQIVGYRREVRRQRNGMGLMRAEVLVRECLSGYLFGRVDFRFLKH